MRLKRVGDWIQYSAEGGQTFYYNDKNGEFQWEDPNRIATDDDKEHDMMEQAKEEDWKPYKDPTTGAIFWYNEKTKVSQWECPLHIPGQELKTDENMPGYAEELVEVYTDADLGL
jgi:hypothetical protein